MSADTAPDWSDLLELDGPPTATRPDRVAADREAQLVADKAAERSITGNRGMLRPDPAIAITGPHAGRVIDGNTYHEGSPVQSDDGYLAHPMEPRAAIRSCESIADLQRLAACFTTLPESVRAPLREAYRERYAFLRQAKAPATLQGALEAATAEGESISVVASGNAARGVVGLTSADVNPVANMANAAAQAAVTYLDGHQTLGVSSPIVPVLASEGLEGGYVPTAEAQVQVALIRARQATARGRRVSPATAPTPASADGTLFRGAIVAGAAAEGFGAIVSWDGLREMTRATMLDVANGHSIEPLKPHTIHAQLGLAVRGWNQRGYVVRSTMRTKGAAGFDFKARYIIGTPDFNKGSDSLGAKVLTVTLENSDTVTYDAHTTEGETLIPGIKTELERLCAGEVYKAGAITDWLVAWLYTQHHAVRCWGGYYIRRDSVAAVEALLSDVMASGWGRNWGLPALPIATSAQLLSGLSNGLIEECNAVLAELESKRDARIADALKAGKSREEAAKLDVTPGVAAGLLVKLDKVAEKVKAHSELLGSAHVADVLRCVTQTRETLRPLADDTSQRFANIADEIGLGH